MEGLRSRLSTLWIVATLNYLYCDVITLMDPASLKQFLAGDVGPIHISQGFLLGAGILVEIPIAMVLLSRILGSRPNRVANVVAGTAMTAVQVLSLMVKTPALPALYYIFFSVIEIACTSAIVWYAWKWRNDERASTSKIESLGSALVAR
jgi:hypothetical protein